MELDDPQGDQEANYACRPSPGRSRYPTPRLHARSAEVMLIGRVLQTVLNDENISRVLDAANDPQRYDEGGEHRLTRQDLQEVRENPGRFVLAAESREFLCRFITQIRIHVETVVVDYSIPLPEDSTLAGTRRQEIDLPEETVA